MDDETAINNDDPRIIFVRRNDAPIGAPLKTAVLVVQFLEAKRWLFTGFEKGKF
jgi:hypothetical protein